MDRPGDRPPHPSTGDVDVDADVDGRRDAAPVHPIVCAACGHMVTTREEAIAVDGRHDHRCVNPHGFIFDIGCFRSAPGADVVGPPEAYFSWFRGTTWQLALCGGCSTHLGWAFSGRDAPFHGLVLERLREP